MEQAVMCIESFAQFPIQTPHQNFITSVPYFERRASMITTKWGQLHVITQKQCRSLVTDKEVVDLVEKVLSDFSNGDAVNPTKLHLPFFPDYGGWNNAMPSWLKKEDIHGIKWAGLSEVNPEKYGLPQCSAVIILNDMETAFPVALMDGTTIMAMRTGAAAAIMAKYCCRTGSKVLTLIGAGVQGNTGLEMALAAMPELTEVRVMDLRQSQVDKLIAKFAPAYPNVTFVGYSDIQEAMNSSDIILTAVHGANNSGQDVLDDKKFEPGQTLVEISGGVSFGKIRTMFDYSVMDSIDAYCHRMNESRGYMKKYFGKDIPELTHDIGDAEIGDIINGKAKGRMNDEQIVHAAGIGMSIEDIIVANTIWRRAKERDIGIVIDLIDDV